MQRRTLILAAASAAAAAVLPAGRLATNEAVARRRRHRHGGKANASASASVTGSHGRTNAAVACNGEHDASSDPTSSHASCRD